MYGLLRHLAETTHYQHHVHHWKLIFSRLSTPSTPAAKRWSLTSKVTPTLPTSNVTLHDHLDPVKSPVLTTFSTHLIFLLYHGFTKALFSKLFRPFPAAPGAHHRHFRIPLVELRTLGFFSRLSNSFLTKGFTQALQTSTTTPTPTPFSDSPPRVTYTRIFSRLSTSIYASPEAVDSNLQRHPYAKMVRHIQGWQTCGPHTLHGPPYAKSFGYGCPSIIF